MNPQNTNAAPIQKKKKKKLKLRSMYDHSFLTPQKKVWRQISAIKKKKIRIN